MSIEQVIVVRVQSETDAISQLGVMTSFRHLEKLCDSLELTHLLRKESEIRSKKDLGTCRGFTGFLGSATDKNGRPVNLFGQLCNLVSTES